MAAGKVTVLNVALDKLGRKVFDLDADSFNVVLTTNAQALSAAFTGTSGQARYSDLTAEVVGAGYTAGGNPLGDATWTRSGAVLTFAADPTAWSALTAKTLGRVSSRIAANCRLEKPGLREAATARVSTRSLTLARFSSAITASGLASS